MINQALEAGRFMRMPVALDRSPGQISGTAIIGRSKSMQEVYIAILTGFHPYNYSLSIGSVGCSFSPRSKNACNSSFVRIFEYSSTR